MEPKDLFADEEYKLKGEFLPDKKEQAESELKMYPNDFKFDKQWVLGKPDEFGDLEEPGLRMKMN